MRKHKKTKTKRVPVPKGWHTLKSGIIRRGHWYIGKWKKQWYLCTSGKNKVVKLDQWGPFESVLECKEKRRELIRKAKRG